jgi:transitional endoplasmic reticulum ATPase
LSTVIDQSEPGHIARIRARSADRCFFHVEFRNGLVGTVAVEEPLAGVDVGSIVSINDDRVDPAPHELWPEETWVGVVRLRLNDVTIVDQSGRLRLVESTTAIDYSERNTVEVSDFRGIVRVLSKDPIRFLDIPAVDESVIANFRADRSTAAALSYEDFGGLREVVERAKELVELPLQHHDKLEAIGARPIKGVLFTGPPGTGKTFLAKIIAQRANAPFYEISGPEIMSKWYGESEEVLRKIFDDAAEHDRAIIFFDEIDSIASRRSDEAHEVSRRVVAQLLTLMDGFTAKQNVVVIAATNRPDDIDMALRRPGRFDWEVVFPLPAVEDRREILRTTARNLATSGDLPHGLIAQKSEGWSAAELAAIWSEAALLAVADHRSVILAEDYLAGFERVAEQRHRFSSDKLDRA